MVPAEPGPAHGAFYGARRSQPVAPVEPDSAADVVDEVRDPVALHDCRRVLEQQRLGQGAGGEERPAGAEDHWDEVDDDLVDQAELERLAADLAAGDVDVTVADELPGGGDRLLHVVDERERSAVRACSQSVGARWVTTKTCSPTAGLPFQPLVRSNSRRPMTFAATLR